MKYEYKVLEIDSNHLQTELNYWGKHAWKLHHIEYIGATDVMHVGAYRVILEKEISFE